MRASLWFATSCHALSTACVRAFSGSKFAVETSLEHIRSEASPLARVAPDSRWAIRLLTQVFHFWQGYVPKIELYYSGTDTTAFEMSGATGEITRTTGTWLPDAEASTRWARWLLVYRDWPELVAPAYLIGAAPPVGSGYVFGSGLSPQVISDLRRVPAQWGNAHSRGRIRVVDTTDDSIELQSEPEREDGRSSYVIRVRCRSLRRGRR